MSDSARPDIAAFRELEQLIRALGDEMAAWRRRAHEAEARVKAAEARVARQGPPAQTAAGAGAAATPATPPAAAPPSSQTNAALQRENQELRLRLEAARQRTKQLMDRVRFLRQQHEIGSAER